MSDSITPFDTDLLILGAGLTGLSAAYPLKNSGLRYRVLEQRAKPGGILRSQHVEGYTLDFGANSFALTPEIRQLVDELGLVEKLVTANAEGNKRYLFRDDRLHAVSPGPGFLFGTRLLSFRGRLRLMREPWQQPLKGNKEETVAAFFTRRLGKEAFTYLVDPVLTGIYAGNPTRMSVGAVLPQVIAWEQKHGSLLRGMMNQRKQQKAEGKPKRVVSSFAGGMDTLPQAIAEAIKPHVQFHTTITGIQPITGGGFLVETEHAGQKQQWRSRQLLWTLPAYAGDLLTSLDAAAAQRVQSIPYAPMLMYSLAYPQKAIGQPLDSFGFLVPGAAKLPLLGAIWNSTVFSGKAPEGQALFTLFVGGAQAAKGDEASLLSQADDAREVFEQVMGIQGAPTFTHHFHWPRAIPQYEIGHADLKASIRDLEARYPGLYLRANWLDGVSVGDRVKVGWEIGEELARAANPVNLNR